MASPRESAGANQISASDVEQERLESWKEIAAYLDRTVRTARRWEKSEGLPVRRHEHLSEATVYAYRHELDAWLAARQPQPPAQKAENGAAHAADSAGVTSAATVAAMPAGFFIPRWLVLAAASAGIGFALLLLYGIYVAKWRFMIVL